jgi:hypothetical protein
MGNKRASDVPYRYPNMEVVHQVDMENKGVKAYPNDPGSNIYNYGCRFTCLLTICQYVTGKALSKQGIIDIYKQCIDEGIMEANCYVKNDNEILKIALAYLGDTSHKIVQSVVLGDRDRALSSKDDHYILSEKNLPGKGIGYFIIVDFLTNSGPRFGGHHFVLYNATGELVYDPYRNKISKYTGVARLIYYKITNK